MAQKRLDEPEMYVGAHAGAIAGMVLFSPTVTQEALKCYLGANAGLVYRYAGHKHCGFQMELNYMQRGWHESTTDYTRELNYLELPILAHFYFGKQYRFFFNLGPQIGYMLYEKETNRPETATYQYAAIDNRFDWGVSGSIGFYARTRAGVYQLETRFNYSLGTLYSNSMKDHFSMSNMMNLSLNFAYMWQIK